MALLQSDKTDTFEDILNLSGRKNTTTGKLYDTIRKTSLYFRPMVAAYRDIDPNTRLVVDMPPPGRYRFDCVDIMRKRYYRYFDANGVPMRPYADTFIYSDTNMCSFALGLYDLYLQTGNYAFIKRMTAVADKILDLGCEELDGIVFRNVIEGSTERGDISAMNQGQSISVLIRVWQVTKEDKYLRAANRAIAPFYVSKNEGGVVGTLPNSGMVWYEEYPLTPFHVLNGMIYGLWGLYDLAAATSNIEAKKLFNTGAESVLNALPEFDTGFWSTYWVPDKQEDRYVASIAYHSCHIIQLHALGDQTGRKEFHDWATKWHRYSTMPVNRARAAIAIAQSKIHQITHGIK